MSFEIFLFEETSTWKVNIRSLCRISFTILVFKRHKFCILLYECSKNGRRQINGIKIVRQYKNYKQHKGNKSRRKEETNRSLIYHFTHSSDTIENEKLWKLWPVKAENLKILFNKTSFRSDNYRWSLDIFLSWFIRLKEPKIKRVIAKEFHPA